MPRRHVWILLALVASCSADPVTPKSETTGTVGGAPLAKPEVTMAELKGNSDWVGTIRVVITEASGVCDLLKNDQSRAGKGSVILEMANGKGDTLKPGAYPVIRGFPSEGTGNFARGWVSRTTSGCVETLSGDGAEFASGQVTLSSYTEGVSVQGTFDVTVASAKLTGSFAANTCSGVTKANLDTPDSCLDGGSDGVGATTLLIESDAGSHVDIVGTWYACYAGGSEREQHVYSPTGLTRSSWTGTTNSPPTCPGGTSDAGGAGTLTFGTRSTITVAGWLSGTGAATAAPAKASGAGNLASTPTVSLLPVTGTIGGNSVSGNLLLFVDDSGAALHLWRDGDGAACQAAYGSNHCLAAVDPLLKLP